MFKKLRSLRANEERQSREVNFQPRPRYSARWRGAGDGRTSARHHGAPEAGGRGSAGTLRPWPRSSGGSRAWPTERPIRPCRVRSRSANLAMAENTSNCAAYQLIADKAIGARRILSRAADLSAPLSRQEHGARAAAIDQQQQARPGQATRKARARRLAAKCSSSSTALAMDTSIAGSRARSH